MLPRWLWPLLGVLLPYIPLASPEYPPQQFLHLSDLHLDPFYGTPDGFKCTEVANPQYGKYGCDSPERLVRSAIAAAKAVLPDPAFIVITGDFVRHAANRMPNSSATALATVAAITHWLEEAFGGATPVLPHHFLPTLGNNDVVPDYEVQVPPEGSVLPNVTSVASVVGSWSGVAGPSGGAGRGGDFFLEHLAQLWQNLLPAEARETFRLSGFYSHEVLPGLFVLSLNTVVYSPYHEPDTEQLDDPYLQFRWMEDTLEHVRGQGAAAYVIGHIPPIVDSYDPQPMWVAKYVARYLSIVRNYNDVVRAQLFGHVHADEFRTFEEAHGSRCPLFMVGAVTPVYDSNPTFRVWNFSRTSKEVLDYTVWYADLDATDEMQGLQWQKEYSALQLFGLRDLSNAEYCLLAHRMETDDATWHNFLRVHYNGVPVSCDAHCRREMVCLFLHIEEQDFEKCANSSDAPAGGSEVSPAPSVPSPGLASLSLWWQLRWWIIAGSSITVCLVALGAGIYFRKALRLHLSRYRPMPAEHSTPGTDSHTISDV